MQDNPELNATAVYVKWIPVPDDRENMKGRVGGYTVWNLISTSIQKSGKTTS